MKINTQEIRRSQFILTYGPGAIIESIYGPRLIKSICDGMGKRFSMENLEKYEIENKRLCTGIQNIVNEYRGNNIISGNYSKYLDNVHIFSPVSNMEVGGNYISNIYYSTREFPEWKICYGKSPGKESHNPILYQATQSKNCPLCKNSDTSSVRFVMACRKGHLDDIQWKTIVHRNSEHKNCNPDYYYWEAGGVSLADITIKCPECQSMVTMNDVYKAWIPCTGRYPESSLKTGCDEQMQVMQRQASSLYLPVSIMLVTIPEYNTGVSNLLNNKTVYATVNPLVQSWENNGDINQNLKILHNYFNSNGLSEEKYITFENYINTYGIEKLKHLLKKFKDTGRMCFMDFVYEEFDSLLYGPRNCKDFVMGEPVTIKNIDNFPALNIYPVKSIKTTTVQIGYTRKVTSHKKNKTDENEDQDHIVSSAAVINDDKASSDNDYWYPGFEGTGEGIFITFSAGEFQELKGVKAYKEWCPAFSNGKVKNIEPWDSSISHPLYVWLHTLSHAIINVLSLYSGYSSASMRERVYIDKDRKNGGILIYASTMGEDSGMGGLSGLVTQEKFRQILMKAKEHIDICSNDPLCMEIRKEKSSQNGAACYSCILISETSCEHRNMFLDRHLVTGD